MHAMEEKGNMKMPLATRLLFFDPAIVADRHNVVQTVVEATKHPGNPILPLGDVDEWDALRAGPWASRTVIYDEEEQLFKCWYNGHDFSPEHRCAMGYAISADGVHWEKPALGLYEYNGNSSNNICLPGVFGPVIKDAGEKDPQRRYKMIAKGPTAKQGLRAAYSADGVRWSEGEWLDLEEWRDADGRQDIGVTRPLDMVVLSRDEQEADPQRRYKLVWQDYAPASKPGPEMVRVKKLGYGADIEHFTASPANPILHPNDGLEQENHFLMWWPYEGYYVVLYEYGWYMPNGTGVFGNYCGDIRLALSRDGEHYQRVQPHQKVIARGGRGEWDDGFLVIADKPVIKDDTIYLYYAGNGEEWTSWPVQNRRPEVTRRSRTTRMGLATLRLDRFACLETADRETPGCATTGPLEVDISETELTVNISDVQQGRSWVEVEVVDAESGEELPGLGREECADLCQDGVRVPVRWKDSSPRAAGVSRVKLRFWIYGAARLYSCNFAKA